MNMKAKMTIVSVDRQVGCDILKMKPVCKTGGYPANGSDENNTFSKFSPSGSLELTVANPKLIGKFEPGTEYYLDFTKVRKPLTLDQIFEKIKAAVERGEVPSEGTHVNLPDYCLMDIEYDEQVDTLIESINFQIAGEVSGRAKGQARIWDLVAVEVLHHPISNECNPDESKMWVRIWRK